MSLPFIGKICQVTLETREFSMSEKKLETSCVVHVFDSAPQSAQRLSIYHLPSSYKFWSDSPSVLEYPKSRVHLPFLSKKAVNSQYCKQQAFIEHYKVQGQG